MPLKPMTLGSDTPNLEESLSRQKWAALSSPVVRHATKSRSHSVHVVRDSGFSSRVQGYLAGEVVALEIVDAAFWDNCRAF